MLKCSVDKCDRDASVSTEVRVALFLRNEPLYCQSHFDSIWKRKHLKRCSQWPCQTCDLPYNPLRFVSKDDRTTECHLCWLETNFPSVPIRNLEPKLNTEVYHRRFFSEPDVIAIVAREKRRQIFPTVFLILYPILRRDLTNLILSMI